MMFRIGQGFDVHQLVEGRPLIIGGVTIPYEKGLLGHSDADVLLHTVADACLGAIGAGDIGKHFPDTDPEFKDADSAKLLQHVWGIVKKKGYALGNADCTIIAQSPKMAPYNEEIKARISRVAGSFSGSNQCEGNDNGKAWFYWPWRRNCCTSCCTFSESGVTAKRYFIQSPIDGKIKRDNPYG